MVHSNEIEVRFDDKPADEFESVLFTHSGAATVSKDGVFKIYDCSPVTNRNVCKSATQDEHKIDFDLVLSHAAFGNTQIQAYAFTKSPESEYPSTTIFYYFKSHGKVWKQMIEHSSLDVAFTNDIHGFLYFSAILKPSTGTIIPEIPIYKISPETPQEMVLFSKIDKKSL